MTWCVYAQQIATVNIGVMSPTEGGSRNAGEAHRKWITTALETQKNITTRHGVYTLNLIDRNTASQESNDYCYEQAKDLVQNEKVAIILGPVSSGCVKSVLSNELPVPVVTTLASATSLTENRNPWFFRANGYDSKRIQKLWNYVDKQIDRDRKQRWLILYEPSKYGMGLLQDLRGEIKDNIEPVVVLIGNDTEENILSDLIRSEFIEGDSLFNFFLLGTSDKVLRAIKEIEGITRDHNLPHNIYTVGSSLELLKYSPPSLVTVGEMRFDTTQNSRLKPELERILSLASKEQTSLYPTTYQAARFIIPQAITRALNSIDNPENLQALREAIRDHLEADEFDSLQPPKMVSFENGNMSDVFEFPIYRIKASYEEVPNGQIPAGWIEFFNSGVDFNYLEAPLKVSFVAHGLTNKDFSLELYKNGKKVQHSQSFRMQDGEHKQITFHVSTPGNYNIYSTTASFPKFASYNVSFSPFYLISLIAAFVAVFLKQKLSQVSWAYRFELLIEGGVIGLGVAFISTYIQYSVLPFTASDWNIINGILYGFVGGWFGPMLITSLTSRVLPGKS
jgi:ABC-type branched-subunit amino acid transport system substrate-binding protein